MRCESPSHPKFLKYGAIGISVCDRWHSFDAFFDDMGHPPSSNHSIDRIDNKGNYEPENCRWATRSEQQNNRSVNHHIVIGGVSRTISEWAKIKRISHAHISQRIFQLKMNPVDAALLPLRFQKNKKYAAFGKTKTIGEWAKERGITKNIIYKRLGRGWTIEDALS